MTNIGFVSFNFFSFNKIIEYFEFFHIIVVISVPLQDAFMSTDETDFEKVRSYDAFVKNTSEYGLKTLNVQKIIHSQDLHFDLVINADFFHESWLMFAHKFNAPIVLICEYRMRTAIKINFIILQLKIPRSLWISRLC